MLPTVFAYLPVAVMMFCAARLGNKYGRRELCSCGLLVAGLGNLILYVLQTDNVWLYIAVLLLSGIGTTFIYLLIPLRCSASPAVRMRQRNVRYKSLYSVDSAALYMLRCHWFFLWVHRKIVYSFR